MPDEPATEAAPEPAKPPETMKSKVERWLVKQGVDLEMRLAGELRRGFAPHQFASSVEHSVKYDDIDEGGRPTLREADVVAQVTKHCASGAQLTLVLVAECKSSKKDPWVFYRSSQPWTMPPNVIIQTAWQTIISSDFSFDDVHDWTSHPLLNATGVSCYSATSAGLEDNRSNQPNHARDAILQVTSAVRGIAPQVPYQSGGFGAAIIVPVVVTSAPMFAVSLLADGSYSVSETKREMMVGRYSPKDEFTRAVWVVNEDFITGIVSEFAETAARIVHRR